MIKQREAESEMEPAIGRTKGMILSREWAWLMGMLGLFLVVNLVISTRQPVVWIDEVMFSDPAINYVNGKGLTSTVWPYQRADELWGGNAPLHTWLLVPWMKMWGTGIRAARSINYVYAMGAALLMWVAVRRGGNGGLIRTPWMRLSLVALVLCEAGVSFSYRAGRYDMLGMLLVCAAMAAMTIRRRGVRMASLFVIALLMPVTGIQLIPMAMVALAVAVFYNRALWREVAAIASGLLAGGIGLFLILQGLGTWPALVKWLGRFSVLQEQSNVGLLQKKMDALWGALGGMLGVNWSLGAVQDFSMPALLLACLIVVIFQMRKGWGGAVGRKMTWACVALTVLIPTALSLGGQFPSYYVWMAAIPLSIAVVMGWERAHIENHKAITWCVGILLVIASMGLPARVAVAVKSWRERDPKPMDAFVMSQVRAGDVAASSFGPFYALHEAGVTTYYPGVYPMSEQEKARVTIVLGLDADSAEEIPKISKEYGGVWKQTGAYGMEANLPYRLAVYRREK